MSSNSFNNNSTARWSDYQDKQLDVLSNIEQSFRANINSDKQLKSSLEGLYKSLDNLISNPKIYKEGTDRAEKLFISMDSMLERQKAESIRRMAAINSTMDRFNMSMDEAANIYDRAIKDQEQFLDKQKAAQEQLLERQKIAQENLKQTAIKLLSKFGEVANDWSKMSNDLITSSGMDGASVRQYRSDLESAVRDLNRTTGYAIDAQKAYSQMISDVSRVTGDLDAMREMTRPMLLAEETLPGNISTIAELFNKFYVKYNFSSKNMEGVLDKIRGNTAGNAATAESNLEAINELSTILSVISKGDPDKQATLMEQVSNYVSKLEASGISHAGATQIIEDLWYGNVDSTTSMIMNRGGSNLAQGKQDALNGNFDAIADDYTQGIYNIIDNLWDENKGQFKPYQLQKVLETYGLDKSAIDIWSTMKFGNGIDLSNLLGDEAPTMEQLTENKYVDLTQKTHNILTSISSILGTIQEKLGVGFSDILTAITIYAGIKSLGFGSSGGGSGLSGATRGIRSIIGSTGNAMVRGSGISGLLASGGYNMLGGAAANASVSGAQAAAIGGLGAAGIAGGALLGYDGVKGALDKEANTGSRVLSGIEAAGGIAGAGLLGASALGLAATGPAGWIALAVGGAALVGKKMYESAHAYEAAGKVVKKSFEKVKLEFNNEILARKDKLGEIEALLSDEANLEEARKKLIDSGLLSEEDIAKARNLNIEGLRALTDAYIEAAEKFGREGQETLDKYSISQQEDANATMKSFKEFYEQIKNIETDANKEFMKQMVEQTVLALNEKADSGSTLSKNEQWFLNKYNEYIREGKTEQKNYEWLLDKGDNLSVFFGAVQGQRLENFSTKANEMSAGRVKQYKYLDPNDITNYVLPITSARNKEEAEAAILAAKAAGIKKEDFSEIEDFLNEHSDWGLTYREGTNYVPEDQIALIHEGEAVVPKKYNPAANNVPIREALSTIRQSIAENRSSNNDTKSSMDAFIEEMRDIKEFLEKWKSDNDKQSRVAQIRNRYYSGASEALRGYYSGGGRA